MAYRYAPLLMARAEILAKDIATLGLKAQILPDSVREYHIKLRVYQATASCGTVIVYYRPSTQTYTLSIREVTVPSVAKQIEALWNGQKIAQAGREIAQATKTDYQAFVDGSYLDGRVGFGAVILHQAQEVARLSGRVTRYTESRQVAGELMAVMQVVDWCKQKQVSEIDVFHDYTGIALAVSSDDSATPVFRDYRAYMQQVSVRVVWHKVAAHTDNYWNEVADELAKQGAKA